MKHALLIALCCTLFTIASGCGNTISTYPPSIDDYVKNSDGRGTAQMWGITFDVVEPVGTSAGSSFDGSLSTDPKKTDARVDITLGDVEIRLDKTPGNPITLTVNGNDLGTLEVGDTVSIDKDRNVQVNGAAREPENAAL